MNSEPAASEYVSAIEAFDSATKDQVAQALWCRELDAASLPPELAAKLASTKNSPHAYGDRMRRFLKYLIEHPLSHTPNLEKNYEHLLPFCEELSVQQAYVMATSFLGAAASVGYNEVPTKASFEFPRDHLPQIRSQIGWHFFVGSCWDVDGNEYGVELMFFQTALFPPNLAAGFGLTDDENQVVELQLAISQKDDRHFQAEPVVLGGTSGLVSYSANPFTYFVGKNSIECHNNEDFFPLTVRAWGLDRGVSPALELGLDITFTSGKEYLFQGADGCMPAVDGIGTLYYSIPNIQLDPERSTLMLDGKTVRLERGSFWFDHQWGFLGGAPRSRVMRAATNSADPKPSGWDWFMVQVTGDRQVTVFAPHDNEHKEFYEQTGPTPPGVMTVQVSGTYMDANKETAMARGTLQITDWIKADHSPNPERYLITNTWYPNGWSFTFDEVVPADIRQLNLTPIINAAQSGFFGNGAQYAEGAVVVTTPDGTDVGRGFAESVSYADTRQTAHRLAGLPESAAHIESLSTRTIPKSLALLNAAYVLAHSDQLTEVLQDSVGLEFFTKPEKTPT